MREGWTHYALGELLERIRRPLPVVAGAEYHQIGLRSFGKGIFHKPPMAAEEVGNKKLFVIEVGDLVFNIVFAWEGAVALAGAGDHGRCGSHRFPTYRPQAHLWLPRYAELFFQSPRGVALLGHASPGSAGRNRTLNQMRLLEVDVEVPPISEQQRIVETMDAVTAAVQNAKAYELALAALGRSQRSDAMTAAWDRVPLDDAVEVTMGRQRSPKHAVGDHMLPYLRAAHAKDGRLVLDDILGMNFTPEEQEKYRLCNGDVLVTEGCGSLAGIGASARWGQELPGVVCFQNTLLRLRARPGQTDAGFLYFWARWAFESGAFAGVASGTNIFHIGSTRAKAMAFPLPTLAEQQDISAALEPTERAEHAARRHHAALAALRASLLPRVLTDGAPAMDDFDAAAA